MVKRKNTWGTPDRGIRKVKHFKMLLKVKRKMHSYSMKIMFGDIEKRGKNNVV